MCLIPQCSGLCLSDRERNVKICFVFGKAAHNRFFHTDVAETSHDSHQKLTILVYGCSNWQSVAGM